jgi:hypothetical protein
MVGRSRASLSSGHCACAAILFLLARLQSPPKLGYGARHGK